MEFDPHATMFVDTAKLPKLLDVLPPPLGFKDKEVPEREMLKFIRKLVRRKRGT
jgi:hypothetical protein